MAKTTAPLLSFGASGQIGKTQVMSTWRGVSYARRYVIPANPQSNAQTQTRGTFAWLSAAWKLLPPAAQSVWTLFAKGRPLTDRNAWVKSNLSTLRGTTGAPPANLAGIATSPGANGGLAAAGIALASGGAGALAITLTAPTLPDGWSIVQAHAVVFLDVEASTSTNAESFYAFDDTAPYVPTFAALATGTYRGTAFFEYLKPDGSTAYSPSLGGSHAVA